ncbi:FKBP-type peptidyl-prolyl cis-trans isomerase [Georgenia sp. 10Sc9-8]|uniref:Peptidyl-prolyl cis-trans isomerase n=1 Tax=Georgenia halotolerans TaxID=3028317 RepID=A0ABT5TZJ8_9MICO|nr:FKBP-type peptidyl-prolyl cis-trans isomerase [Georgenia halotolerans]
MPLPARLRRTLLALLLVVLVAGCAPEDGDAGVGEVAVSGPFGSVPTIEVDTPLPMQDARTEVLVEGDGRVLAGEEPVLFALTAFDGQDGEVVAERGVGEARTLMLAPADVGEDLYPVLVGTPEGSRLLVRQPVTEDGADRMLLLVIDVLHTRAHGTEQEVPDHLPQVSTGPEGEPSITLPEEPPPDDLVITRVIRGEGPRVRPGQHTTVQYTGVEWETGEQYDSTWAAGKVPQTVRVDETFPGLRAGLVGQPVGSRVLLVIPPDQAVGTETLVLVVDVLATSGGEEDLAVPPGPDSAQDGQTSGS